jgi:ABC-type multidrug transport system fused ATPase/permease subunit
MFITEKRVLKWALYCNAIYVVLLFLFRPNGINIQKISITSFLLFSVLSLFLLCFKNRKKLRGIPKLARILFYILLFWGSVVIVRSFSFSLQDWVTNFGNVYMALAWLVPIVLILGLKIENWNIVFKAIKFMFQLMILVFLISPFYAEIKTEWTWLLRPVNFILLIGLYHYRFIDRILIYVTIGIYFVIAIRVQQRMEFLYLALVLGFLVLDKLMTVKIKRSFLKYILAGFIIVFTLIFTVGYEHVSSIIASLIEFEDSRTFLYTELFDELAKTNDKLLGRGALGTYYSAFFENTRTYWENIGRIGWAGDVPNRITTEVGYLQMILKGGFIMLFLNVTIAIYAVYVALFKSKNKLIRRLGYYILIISILSLVSFRPAFTPTFIVFWMAIGTVFNKKNRMLKDDEVNKLIQF